MVRCLLSLSKTVINQSSVSPGFFYCCFFISSIVTSTVPNVSSFMFLIFITSAYLLSSQSCLTVKLGTSYIVSI
uniref:Uncharacterized protein n=1 Tax=Anguilla anguilla TaxID=7936 RepID=A0A0E9WLF0_ANGAN